MDLIVFQFLAVHDLIEHNLLMGFSSYQHSLIADTEQIFEKMFLIDAQFAFLKYSPKPVKCECW